MVEWTGGSLNDLWHFGTITPGVPKFDILGTAAAKVIVPFTGGLLVTIFTTKRKKTG